jgi:hypothetical protein
MSVGEPGHELTATPRDQGWRGATICECGWVSKPGVDAQPFLEEGTAGETAWIGCYAGHVLAGSLVCR